MTGDQAQQIIERLDVLRSQIAYLTFVVGIVLAMLVFWCGLWCERWRRSKS